MLKFSVGQIDTNVFLWPLTYHFSSMLPVMLVLFHELSYALNCCQMQQKQSLFSKKKKKHSSLYCPLIFSFFLLSFLMLVNFPGLLSLCHKNECAFNLSTVFSYMVHTVLCLHSHLFYVKEDLHFLLSQLQLYHRWAAQITWLFLICPSLPDVLG